MRSLFLLSLLLICLFPSSAASEQSTGLVTARPCPHSCKTMGLDKKYCKDWKRGNVCYVEDLKRKPAAHKFPGGVIVTPGSGNSGRKDCRTLSRIDVAPPYITLRKVKPSSSGGFFGGKRKLRVEGEVEGRCLKDAAIYEEGRKKINIPVRTQSNFQRFQFNVKVDADDYPEVRVYNVFGERAQESIRHYDDR